MSCSFEDLAKNSCETEQLHFILNKNQRLTYNRYMTQATFTTNDKNILTKALKDKKNLRFHKRIQCVLFRIDGLSYRKIAELTGLSPQTASNQVRRYQEQGLAGLLTDKRGGSFRYYMTHDEEIHFLAEQFKKASQGDLLTIASLHEAYQSKIGKKSTREGFYALLKRHGWRKVIPRPEHLQKADAQAIVTSKNKILVREHMQTIA